MHPDTNPSDSPASVTWRVRYRFRLSTKMNADGEVLEFELDSRRVTLKARLGEPLAEADQFILLAGGFASEADARAFGMRLKHALLAAAAVSGVGVDLGDDKPTSKMSDAYKKALSQQHNVAMYDDVHGVMTYPEHPEPCVLSVSGKGIARIPPEHFITPLTDSFARGLRVPDDLDLAIDLYCASSMEQSPIARLLLALASIEEIAGRPPRPPKELELLSLARQAVEQASTEQSSRDIVIEALNHLQRVSIGRACRDLINCNLPDEAEEFREASRFRGKIAHSHQRADRKQAARHAGQAQRVARKLIKKMIEEAHRSVDGSENDS
jgi:hypothetical protein